MGVYITYTPRLPSEYQEVEYIQSTGNQYIDTGYNYNGTYFRIDFQLMFNSYSYGGTGANVPFICGVIGRSSGNMFMSVGANDRVFGIATGTEMATSLPVQLGVKYDTMLEYKSGTMTFKSNGSTVTTSSTGTFYTGKSIPIFCRWDIQYSGLYSYFCTDMRMYGCKIYSAENTLARNFVPCYRKSDSVIGMYDLVNNQFYTNSGSGTFSKGNDVTMVEMKNAYIGEYVEETYTLTGVPDGDVNKYISIAKSGNTVKKVVFEYTSNNSSTSTNTWVRISGTNNTANRYGIGFTYNAGNPQIMVNGNINSASPTTFLNLAKSGGIYNVKFTIESGKTTLETTGQNTISQTRTQTTAEKNIVDTVLNSSTINAYASRSGATISDITITVIYEPN